MLMLYYSLLHVVNHCISRTVQSNWEVCQYYQTLLTCRMRFV